MTSEQLHRYIRPIDLNLPVKHLRDVTVMGEESCVRHCIYQKLHNPQYDPKGYLFITLADMNNTARTSEIHIPKMRRSTIPLTKNIRRMK